MPYNTTITSWQFFATPGPVALAPAAGPETLTAPRTNPLRYVPGQISGHKFVGTVEDNDPAAGWTIELYRNGGTEPYMTAVTAADGTYSFTGLLPGTYRRHLLESGRVRECTLTVADALAADRIVLVNSVRGERLAELSHGACQLPSRSASSRRPPRDTTEA